MLKLVYSYLKFIFQVFYAIYRDLSGAKFLIKAKRLLGDFEKNKSTVFDEFKNLVRENPQKACIIFEDKTWTFKDVILQI